MQTLFLAVDQNQVGEIQEVEMTEQNVRTPDFFDRVASGIGNKYNAIKRNFAKQKFEREIKARIELANAHRTKGVKKGDATYGELYQECIVLIGGFTSTWGGDVQSILNNAPALRELKEWSEFEPVQDQANKAKIVVLVVIGSPIAIGIMIGIGQIACHAITFWIR